MATNFVGIARKHSSKTPHGPTEGTSYSKELVIQSNREATGKLKIRIANDSEGYNV